MVITFLPSCYPSGSSLYIANLQLDIFLFLSVCEQLWSLLETLVLKLRFIFKLLMIVDIARWDLVFSYYQL